MTTVAFNGKNFQVPATGEDNWGGSTKVDGLLIELATASLQKTGGLFTLSADVDWGPTAGHVAPYYKSHSANIAASGVVRLAVGDTIAFRNNANNADLALGVNGSDQLTFSGTKVTLSGAIVNADIASGAAIAYSKLALSGAIQNSDLAGSIAYSKLVLTGAIVSGDLAGNIARSKLAAGSANQVLINDGSGNLSSEATLAISRGGTGQATTSAAFDALSPTTTKGDIIVRTSTTNVAQPIGTDGQVLVSDSSQTNGLKWTTLNQGAKNYVTYNNFENNATTGWSLSHSTLDATTKLPNQASASWTSAAGTLTIAVVSSGQLAGSYSLSLASSGATTAGDMLVSQAYTIDLEDQAKVLTFKFYYKAQSGASNGNFSGTSSNSFGVAIYDVTNSAWIQPAGVWGMTQSSGVGYCTGTFQTPSNMTQFRFAIFNANASSGAVTLYLDDFQVGPQTAPYGPVITDWQSYTPTISPISGYAASWSPQGFWRRVGQNLEGYIKWRKDTNAGTGAGALTFSLPSGYTIDTSITEATDTTVGFAKVYNFVLATAYDRAYGLNAASTTTIGMRKPGAAGVLVGTDVGANAEFYAHFTVPIVGWSSNVQMSNDTETRVVAFSAYKNSSQTLSTNNSAQKITIDTVLKDSHGAFDTVNNRYVASVPGWYVFSANVYPNNTNILNNRYAAQLFVNGSLVDEEFNAVMAAATGDRRTATFKPYYLNAGDYAELYFFGQGNNSASTITTVAGSTNTWFAGYRLSGPSVVAATETVVARYTTTAGQSIANGATPQINYDTKVYDSHGAVTTGASWKFTAPVPGKYRVSAYDSYASASFTSLNAISLAAYKNGSQHSNLGFLRVPSTGSSSYAVFGSATIDLLAGDTLDLRTFHQESTARSLDNSGSYSNYICIERVGN